MFFTRVDGTLAIVWPIEVVAGSCIVGIASTAVISAAPLMASAFTRAVPSSDLIVATSIMTTTHAHPEPIQRAYGSCGWACPRSEINGERNNAHEIACRCILLDRARCLRQGRQEWCRLDSRQGQRCHVGC